jgi:EpsI family protein
MPSAKVERRAILVPLFLAAQCLAAWSAGHREKPPASPDLEGLPQSAGEWRMVSRNEPSRELMEALRPDRLFDRNYEDRSTASQGNLFVAWYRSQLAGNSQPHSPRMCLPGAGWMPVRTGEATLLTAAGPIQVNRWLVAKGEERAAVLYWYQKPRRVVAGEWATKLWLGVDALRDRRTDLAFVRLVVWSHGGRDDLALSGGDAFAREIYPQLREALPH